MKNPRKENKMRILPLLLGICLLYGIVHIQIRRNFEARRVDEREKFRAEILKETAKLRQMLNKKEKKQYEKK